MKTEINAIVTGTSFPPRLVWGKCGLFMSELHDFKLPMSEEHFQRMMEFQKEKGLNENPVIKIILESNEN